MLNNLNNLKRIKDVLSQFFLIVLTTMLITLPFQEIFFKTDISGIYDLSVLEIKDGNSTKNIDTSGTLLRLEKDKKGDSEKLIFSMIYLFLIFCLTLLMLILVDVKEKILTQKEIIND